METPIYRIVETPEELLKAFSVRSIVFMEEQACPYGEEFDRHEFSATHFVALDGDEPAATARIRHITGAVKIERLAVRKRYRGAGIGPTLLGYILSHIESLGYDRIVLHAQAHLTGFYERFGFMRKGDTFLEAGIEHYLMVKGF